MAYITNYLRLPGMILQVSIPLPFRGPMCQLRKKTCEASAKSLPSSTGSLWSYLSSTRYLSGKMQRFLFMEKKQNGIWLCNNSKRRDGSFYMDYYMDFHLDFQMDHFIWFFFVALHSEPTDVHIKETKKAKQFTQRNHVISWEVGNLTCWFIALACQL